MPKIIFQSVNIEIDVQPESKVLASAIRNKVPIRYGCGACRCGTCGIAVDASKAKLNPIDKDEMAMLKKIKLATDGSVRLACKTKMLSGELIVDLDFQDTYSPEDNFELFVYDPENEEET